MLPGFVLGARAIWDIHLVDWKPALLVAVVLALLLMFAVSRADMQIVLADQTSARFVVAIAVLGMASMYCYGAIAEADMLLDSTTTPETYRVAVVRKHVSHGKNHDTPYLTLDPWGPRTDTSSVSVSWPTYNAVVLGQTVCINLRPGALKLPWYTLYLCDGTAGGQQSPTPTVVF